jgi:hypothetical protein
MAKWHMTLEGSALVKGFGGQYSGPRTVCACYLYYI